MTTIDTHALNQLLAKVAGVEVYEVTFGEEWNHTGWGYGNEEGMIEEWSPCSDANQLELVEEQLRKKDYGYEVTWFRDRQDHRAIVWKPEDSGTKHKQAWHENKLIAFALAVQAMEEGT